MTFEIFAEIEYRATKRELLYALEEYVWAHTAIIGSVVRDLIPLEPVKQTLVLATLQQLGLTEGVRDKILDPRFLITWSQANLEKQVLGLCSPLVPIVAPFKLEKPFDFVAAMDGFPYKDGHNPWDLAVLHSVRSAPDRLEDRKVGTCTIRERSCFDTRFSNQHFCFSLIQQ